jgi:hypothetical protein
MMTLVRLSNERHTRLLLSRPSRWPQSFGWWERSKSVLWFISQTQELHGSTILLTQARLGNNLLGSR